MSYKIAIRKAATGEVRIYELEDCDWEEMSDGSSGSWFTWEGGNLGCTCNLENFFERAGGDADYWCDEHPEHGEYTVLYAILPNGTLKDVEQYVQYIETGVEREVRTRPEQWT